MKAAGMEFMREELMEHFAQKMVPYIARLQPAPKPTQQASSASTPVAGAASLDAFGEEILECCQSLSLYQVRKIQSFVCCEGMR